MPRKIGFIPSQSPTPPSKFHKYPNCSVVHIHDNEVYLFNNRLYYTVDSPIDYATGRAIFFVNSSRGTSLNQDPAAAKSEYHILNLSLNMAFEVFERFKEIELENERRLQQVLRRR